MENTENCWHSPETLEEADFVVRIYMICTCFLVPASHRSTFSLQVQLVLFWFLCCGLIFLLLFLNLLILNQSLLSKTKLIILPSMLNSVLNNFMSTWHKLKSSRGGSVNEKNASIRSSCRAFSEWLPGRAQLTVDGAILGLVVFKKAGWVS